MPGISTVFSSTALHRIKVARSLGELRHREHYKLVEHFPNDNTVIGFSGYEGYPIHQFEDKNVLFLMEGLIYDKKDEEIGNLIRRIVHNYSEKKEYKRQITKLVQDSDGDYIGLIYFKNNGSIIIFNDRWGRLPSFFLAENQIFAFSRERKFLLHWIQNIKFDKVAMAEFLMYRFNLGEKTLVRGIKRLYPATILEIESSDGQIHVTKEALLPVNFETKDLKISRNDIINKCVKLYKESLSARVKKIQEKGLHIVADLSGGYDTRAIFGGLCQLGIDFTPCTDNHITGDESNIARQLTDYYNKKLCQSFANHPVDDFAILRKLTYLTDCTVNGWTTVSSYYDSLEREKLFTTKTTRFMGFGGEFIRHPYKVKNCYPNFCVMLQDAAWMDNFRPSWALAITKLDSKEFSKNLEHEVVRFPERGTTDKVKHLYFEYYNRLVNGGEDRHRMFWWTVQPLWGRNLLTFEMKNIPQKIISFKFFIDFLEKLDHRLLRIPIYKNSLSLNSRIQFAFFRIKMYLKAYASANRYLSNFFKWANRKFRRNPKEFSSFDEVRKLFQSNFVCEQFNITAIEKFLNQSPRVLEVYRLLTLMIYVDEVGRRFGLKVKG